MLIRPGINKHIYYVWESRWGGEDIKLYPKMHYAIEYNIQLQNGTISSDSNLWMGFIRTAAPLRRFEMTHTDWLDTKPIKSLTKPNDRSSIRNDEDL